MRNGFFVETLRKTGVLGGRTVFLSFCCHRSAQHEKKLSSVLCMKHQVDHCGVTVNVRKVSVRRDGVAYAGWQILDYCNGKRVRHQRPTLKAAKAKAREV